MFKKIADQAGGRLDTWLTEAVPEHSRSRWQSLIKEGRVSVNGAPCKANQKIHAGDCVEWSIPDAAPAGPQAENISLNILYEDRHIIVINKPAGLVVHPAVGNETGTLVNALLHHCKDLTGIGGEKRPGIVHRLDKDTSGVMVAAKNEAAMMELSRQFKEHGTEKEYLTIVRGVPCGKRGVVETTIGRHPIHRKKMAANVRNGRPAVSHYEVVEAFGEAALVRVKIETGRTHQIRVHMAHIKNPVIGDTVYGCRRASSAHAGRQMLHAAKLSLNHPKSGKRLTFEAPLPDDMEALLTQLRADLKKT
ncbi:MAG: RluA family pseudouridine synthase [Pontiellaceae bacterium]|nr:RluA family pseudouridine synthase [Pontiellaceae bacterium]